jgi:predicted ester cyclase
MENNLLITPAVIEAMTPVEKVIYFWNNVWSYPYNVDLIDSLMVEDFKITTAGKEISGRDEFKKWVTGFLKTIDNAHLENLDIFESKCNTKVVSRWKFTGLHNGMFGLAPNKKPISLTGTAIWLIKDNKLAHNWVERSSWEVFQQVSG